MAPSPGNMRSSELVSLVMLSEAAPSTVPTDGCSSNSLLQGACSIALITCWNEGSPSQHPLYSDSCGGFCTAVQWFISVGRAGVTAYWAMLPFEMAATVVASIIISTSVEKPFSFLVQARAGKEQRAAGGPIGMATNH